MPDNSDKVSNVSAGVESGRQAPGASGAGGHKDDKRDGHKTPRKGPSGVKKKAQKRCYVCRQVGHLQRNCPYQAAFRAVVDMLSRDPTLSER